MSRSVWKVPLFPCEGREHIINDFGHVKFMLLPGGSSNCFWIDAKSHLGEVACGLQSGENLGICWLKCSGA